MPARDVAAHLAARGEWRFSRSSGPGGQNRDHNETRAELTVRAGDLEGLEPWLARRLCDRLGLEGRPLRLMSQAERSRRRNEEIVAERLAARVAEALAPAPPPRRPTRPSAGARRRRRAEKSHRGEVKSLRRPPGDSD